MSARRTAITALLAILIGACGSTPPSAPPSPVVAPTATASPSATPTPSVTDAPTPSPSLSIAPSPTPAVVTLPDFTTAAPLGRAAQWTKIQWRKLDAADPLGQVRSVVRWKGGYLALGAGVGDTADPATVTSLRTPIWVSADGVTWKALEPEVFGPATVIIGVAELPGGFAAMTLQSGANEHCSPGDMVDIGCFDPGGPLQSWTSKDGLSWSAHPGPDGAGAFFGSTGKTLFAMDYAPGGFKVAVSTDGITWQSLAKSPLPKTYTSDSPAVVSAPGSILLAGGSNLESSDTGVRASLPRSTDGRRWTSITLPDTTPGEGEGLGLVYVGQHGLLAWGNTAAIPGDTLWWHSSDGVHWSAVHGFAPLGVIKSGAGAGHNPDGAMASDGLRIVAYRDGSSPLAWSSFDGATWQRLAMTGTAPKQAQFFVLPMGILAVSDAGVWFGRP